MPVHRSLLVLAAFAFIGAACAAPGATPPAQTVPPPPAPTEEAAAPTPTTEPTGQPTAAPATAATPSPTPASRNPDDYYGGGRATPTPAAEPDAATLEIASTADAAEYLIGPSGLALYTFTRDRPGQSNCAGDCAATWPPLTVEDGEEPTAGAGIDGDLDVIERDDGSLQVTLDGHPLYHFVGDEGPDDTNGDGLGGVWFLARP